MKQKGVKASGAEALGKEDSQRPNAPTPQRSEEGLLASIDRYWFGYGSPTSLGILRILIGTLAFANFLMIGIDWEAWFSERGFVPHWLGAQFQGPNVPVVGGSDVLMPRLNLLSGVTNDSVALAFYAATTLFALLTALGLWTRVSAIALALGVVSLHHRNSAILHGGDTVLRLAVLYLAISPCGKACSLDRLIALWRGKIGPEPPQVSLWPQRLVTFNVALIYLTTVWLKRGGNKWMDGTATWYTARLNEFDRFPVPTFFDDFPFVYVSTYGTLIVEFSLATLVFFRPLRRWVILAGLGLHAFIEYSMNIPLFSFLICSCYICFYEGDEISGWAKRFGARVLRRAQVVVRHPHGTQLKPRAMAFLRAVDPFGLVTYAPGEGDGWSAEKPSGKPISASRASWTRSVGSWLFAWIPGLWSHILHASIEPAPEAPPTQAEEREKRSKTKR